MILLLIALGCPSGEIPPHLQVDRPVNQVSTHQELGMPQLIRTDPLVRRPKPLAPGDWMGLPAGSAIEAWAAVARSGQVSASDWTTLEQNHQATIAVPLARGAKLAALEVLLAEDMDESAQQQAAGWLGATRVEVRPTTTQARAPLDWLPGALPADKRSAAIVQAERSVLLGWLSGPDIDVGPAARALAAPAHTRLMATPAGTLLLSRARVDRSSDSAALGRTALITATTLALATVAADRDTEQDKLKTRISEAAEALRTKDDPVSELLERARIGLSADAGNPASAGLALVAITAQRLDGSCPDRPCAGLDRTKSLAHAARWSPEASVLARAWRVVALKQAADTFAASHKKPSFGASILDVVDPLTGTGGGPVELSLLRYRTAEPTAILQISRLAGHPSTTDPDETSRAINRRLVAACESALKGGLPAAAASQVRKIQKRARR